MKYMENERIVKAIYDEECSRNPLLDALPEFMDENEFNSRISNYPVVPVDTLNMNLAERKRGILNIKAIFVPLPHMYYIYDAIYRMISSTYLTKSSRENVMRTNAILEGSDISTYSTQTMSGAFLGFPGLGKTESVKRILSLIPQVIEHERYLGTAFYSKQVTWIFVDCPSDCSIKGLCFNIIRAIDEAIGGNNFEYALKMKSSAVSAITAFVKVLLLTYNVGILTVDEIQHLVVQAKRGNSMKSLIKFLTELCNDSSTSVYLVGTNLAESVFQETEYLRRRTRGLRLTAFRFDGMFIEFLQKIWKYQYTAEFSNLTHEIAEKIYDYSGGITAYVIKIFEEAQNIAILSGDKAISVKHIKSAAETLSIKVPDYVERGKALSDFKEGENVDLEEAEPERKREYSIKRGRKPVGRDEDDLILSFKEGALLDMLAERNYLEVNMP